MSPQEIAEIVKSQFPSEVIEIVTFRDQLSLLVKKSRIFEIMTYLHDSPDLSFDYLADLCGVDYQGRKDHRFEVVYNLLSIQHNHPIRIKAMVSEIECSIDSVVGIWAGANWHERECYDMFGITFNNHPDLRRILMPDDWEGYPLRKDYPLKSDLGEKEWDGFKQVIETAERNKIHEVH
jgi:NADH-quinone oxidoreductase subunit C